MSCTKPEINSRVNDFNELIDRYIDGICERLKSFDSMDFSVNMKVNLKAHIAEIRQEMYDSVKERLLEYGVFQEISLLDKADHILQNELDLQAKINAFNAKKERVSKEMDSVNESYKSSKSALQVKLNSYYKRKAVWNEKLMELNAAQGNLETEKGIFGDNLLRDELI